LALSVSATFFACKILRIPLECLAPSRVGGWVAVGVGSTEGSWKPLTPKKCWVVEIPSVGVFVTDRIAEGQTRFTRLVRQISWPTCSKT
jgi:hypothetical protein